MAPLPPPPPRWMLLAMGVMLGLLCRASIAREAVVTLGDGRQLQGELIERTDEQVVLEIAGVRAPIERRAVANMRLLPSIEKRYQRRRATLSADDLAARRALARWLIEEEAYDLAATELKALRRRFPDNARVRMLWRLVRQRQQQPTQEGQGPATATRPAGTQPALPLDQRLTREQINLMRVWEVDDPLESRPRVRVPNEVLRQLLAQYADHPAMPRGPDMERRILEAPGYEQLELMFRLGAREFYGRARMITDPQPLQRVRAWLHERYVLGYCARPQCHGGKRQGDLPLFRRQSATDRTFYSNFYSLSRYENADGQMINRRRPSESLLLTYGLPRGQTKRPHPEVEGWRPYFRDADGREYQGYLQMIEGLYDEPDYTLNTDLLTAGTESETPKSEPAAPSQPSPATMPSIQPGVLPRPSLLDPDRRLTVPPSPSSQPQKR